MRENRGEQEGIYLYYESGAAHLAVAQTLHSFTPTPKHKALLVPSPSLCAFTPATLRLGSPSNPAPRSSAPRFPELQVQSRLWWGTTRPCFG